MLVPSSSTAHLHLLVRDDDAGDPARAEVNPSPTPGFEREDNREDELVKLLCRNPNLQLGVLGAERVSRRVPSESSWRCPGLTSWISMVASVSCSWHCRVREVVIFESAHLNQQLARSKAGSVPLIGTVTQSLLTQA